MKIGLLTYNLGQNYGGILQAYALMNVLKKLSHEPELLYIETKYDRNWKSFIKSTVLSHFTSKYNFLVHEDEIFKNMFSFIDNHIYPKTNKLTCYEDFKNVTKNNYEAYIVGSDQVWRADLYKYIDFAFFDFVKNDEPIFISYAPSFGVDVWNYSDQDTIKFKNQIKRFSGVSVREESGVSLCKKHFDVDAIHVLDPTALLGKDVYQSLISMDLNDRPDGELLTYILDDNEDKRKLTDRVSSQLSYKNFKVGPKEKNSNKIKDMIYPPVTSWLQGFNDAKFVITDSFHGCVFSVIFNKPFIVYGNKKRGMARFKSFLGKLGLENRLIEGFEFVTNELIEKDIDWVSVNEKLRNEQENSISYLKKHLNKV
ncbi:polysaccharide pyruvyl transferase family protein [Vibrio furnissii]|uniref:polysaccharide pyruvyl transferase family protein n=1 Tax=Vibrio furnissii TaxID=29494 RepID=UPI001EEA029A|nr:polysaccharide pyruvyl transferase family protein [Vibrio furnissii]MCG6267268.1 polysaccharide pyruvyl transferase family protein [Vibrio furnissii]